MNFSGPALFRLNARQRGPKFCVLCLLCLLCLACTRYEDSAVLSRRSSGEWTLSWTIIARRGLNLVDSSGNVGSASAHFPCTPKPDQEGVFLIDGPASHWSASGATQHMLGPPAQTGWNGSATLNMEGGQRTLDIRIFTDNNRPFAGNRRYKRVNGNGETWCAW